MGALVRQINKKLHLPRYHSQEPATMSHSPAFSLTSCELNCDVMIPAQS